MSLPVFVNQTKIMCQGGELNPRPLDFSLLRNVSRQKRDLHCFASLRNVSRQKRDHITNRDVSRQKRDPLILITISTHNLRL